MLTVLAREGVDGAGCMYGGMINDLLGWRTADGFARGTYMTICGEQHNSTSRHLPLRRWDGNFALRNAPKHPACWRVSQQHSPPSPRARSSTTPAQAAVLRFCVIAHSLPLCWIEMTASGWLFVAQHGTMKQSRSSHKDHLSSIGGGMSKSPGGPLFPFPPRIAFDVLARNLSTSES